MILIDPITGGEVETFTDKATMHLTAKGYTPKLVVQPKKTTRKRTSKSKEQ